MQAVVRLVLSVPLAAVVVACGVPNTGNGWNDPEPGELITGPYVLLGDPGTAYVAFRANTASALVEWGLASPVASTASSPIERNRRVTAERRDDLWVATLADLPDTGAIWYRVVTAEATLERHRIQVGSAPGRKVRFVVFGDTRTRHSVHRAVIDAVSRETVDFLVHTGDMVERGGIRQQWDTFFQIERPLLRTVPILPSIGNHDIGARGYYRHYFLHELWAKNRRYYKKDWGNLRLIAMDGGIECRDGCAQYAYVRKALADAADKGMLIVMFLHYPPYSSGDHGSHKGVQKPITDLAKKYGVELVIAGHDHNYERTVPIHGTTYVVSGSAGAPVKAVKPQWFTAHARTEPHYVLVDVENDRLTMRAVNLRGETFDSHVVKAVAPQP